MRPHQRIPVRVITLVAALAAVAGCRMGKPDFTQASPSDPAIVSQTQEVPVAAPRSYRCERASEPPALEGTFDDGAWSRAAWTEDFVVVRRRGPAGSVRTRAKLLWDDSYLYCAVELLEPQVAPQPGVPPVRHDVELMVADDAVRALIHNRAAESQLVVAAEAAGLRSMREDGQRQIDEGITSPEEVMSVTRD